MANAKPSSPGAVEKAKPKKGDKVNLSGNKVHSVDEVEAHTMDRFGNEKVITHKRETYE